MNTVINLMLDHISKGEELIIEEVRKSSSQNMVEKASVGFSSIVFKIIDTE